MTSVSITFRAVAALMVRYFQHCRCPHCKMQLDEVRCDQKVCPSCRLDLDPSAVWQTRRYPGMLMLPGWVRAFGWPLLMMLLGAGSILGAFLSGTRVNWRASGGSFFAGMIWFFYILSGGDDD